METAITPFFYITTTENSGNNVRNGIFEKGLLNGF